MVPPGNYHKQSAITSIDSVDPFLNNLSSSTASMGADGWSSPGQKVRMWGGVHTNAINDLDKYMYATNIFQKFDDECFQPLSTAKEDSFVSYRPGTMNFKLRYAAKPGGIGWISDTEMNVAKEEDLEYFKSMSDLKAKYPSGVCVAVLIEGREGMHPVDRTEIGFDMQILETAEVGKVYQTTNNIKIWNEINGTQMTFEDSMLSNDPVIKNKLKNPDFFIDGNTPHCGPYIKTQYDENGNIVSNTHAPEGYNSGASVLIVGLEATITKSVDQKSGSNPKQVYDVAIGQRRVDYVLSPQLNLAGGKEGVGPNAVDVTIIDTLPKNIAVTPSTKYYYGGTYEEDASNINGGELVGGTELELETGYPLLNADGTTTLKWVIKDVIPGETMKKIHFSASIGNPGAPDDVSDGDQLTNTVTIQAEGDRRSIHASHGNISKYTILMSKLSSSSFIKMIETPIEEVNTDLVYTLSESNISQNKIPNYSMLDVLPANEDGRGSKIDGTYKSKLKVDLSSSISSDTKLKVYTTTTSMLGKKVTEVTSSEFTLLDTVNKGESKTLNPPTGTTAYYVEGSIGGRDNYQMTLTLTPTNNKGGNVYANDASSTKDGDAYTYAPTVAGVIIERKVTGLVWLDTNKDGIRQGSEEVLSGVKVSLIDLNTKKVALDIFGNTVGSVITGADGRYEFGNLKEGNYRVTFESDTLDLEEYCATLQNIGNVQTSSKGTPRVDRLGVLLGAYIEDINLPAKEQVSAYGYTAAYNDLGLYEYEPNEVLVIGKKELTGYKETSDIKENQFTFLMKEDIGNDKSGYTGMPTETIGVNEGGNIYFGNLIFTKVGIYKFTLEEIDGGEKGYTYDDKIIEITVKVTRNTETQELEANATYTVDGVKIDEVVFENDYTPLSTDYTPSVQKIITGDIPNEDTEFIFKLVAENDNTPMPLEDELKILGEGQANFGSIEYKEAGVYRYQVYEMLGEEKGYEYDDRIYMLVVTVKDVEGQLEVSAVLEDRNDDHITFTNNYITPIEELEVTKQSNKDIVTGGDKILYTLTVKNTGNQPLIGIRVRDYVPEYTLFDEVYDNGEYGVIDGKEHVTWFIEELGVGEEVQLRFKVIVDDCIPNDYVIKNTALYEILGDKDKPDANNSKDPSYKTNEVRNPTDGSVLGSTYEEPKVEKLEVINERVITSDNTNIVMIGILAGVSLSVIIFLKKNKKKEV